MRTGELPFGDGVRALHAIQEEPVPPIDPGLNVPERLAGFMYRCLEKDRSARFESAEAMHDALVDVMRSEASHATQRDVAELVAVGPVSATVAAIPSAQPTTAEVAPPAATEATVSVGVSASAETAVVAPAKQPERRGARLPWILIGVLFGMLIAGGVSTAAFMVDDSPDAPGAADAGNAIEPDAGQPEKIEDVQNDDKSKKKGKKGKGKGKQDRDREEKKKKDEEKRTKEEKKLQKEREKRQREIEKRLERDRRKLEKKAREATKDAIEDFLDR